MSTQVRSCGSLFGDLQNLADLGDLLALAKSNVRLAELLDNLIGRVSCLLSSSESPFRAAPGCDSLMKTGSV